VRPGRTLDPVTTTPLVNLRSTGHSLLLFRGRRPPNPRPRLLASRLRAHYLFRLSAAPRSRRPPHLFCRRRTIAISGIVGTRTITRRASRTRSHIASSAAAGGRAYRRAVCAAPTLSAKKKHTSGGWRKRPDLKQECPSLALMQRRCRSDQSRELLQRRSVRLCDCDIGAVYENDEPTQAASAPQTKSAAADSSCDSSCLL
jgi:hypothetical protein